MTKHQFARRSRDLAASDGFNSLCGGAPHVSAQAFAPCLHCEAWRTSPVASRRAALISGMLRRLAANRRSSAAESV
jgi:hypothetical protein